MKITQRGQIKSVTTTRINQLIHIEKIWNFHIRLTNSNLNLTFINVDNQKILIINSQD